MGLGTARVELCASWRSHGLRGRTQVVEDGRKRDADRAQTFIARAVRKVVLTVVVDSIRVIWMLLT